jgi:enediyne biosynthesis protein E4
LGSALLAGCAGGPSVVETVDLPACESPAEGPQYVDALADSGIDFVHDSDVVPPDSLAPEAVGWLLDLGGAVAAADFDQDGFDDLFLGQTAGPSRLYWGRGDGTFDVDEAFVDLSPSLVTSVSASDFDGDGLIDLTVGAGEAVLLFEQQTPRRFIERGGDVGIPQRAGLVTALPWGDPDGDGDLDLFVGRYAVSGSIEGGAVRSASADLLRNDVGGFSTQTAALALPGGDPGATLFARWADLDDDGDADLLQSNDAGGLHVNSFLHENRGGFSFFDRLPDTGLPLLETPRGVAVRDLDGDGGVDLWFGGVGSHRVYGSAGEWVWEDVSLEWPAGLPADLSQHSWSVLDVDADGDGVPGLFVTYGGSEAVLSVIEGPSGGAEDGPDLFLAPSGGAWSPSAAVPDEGSQSRGAALADFNSDGVPDVAVGRLGGAPGLYLGRCTSNTRLVVRLRDRAAYNRFGLGAKVTVDAGGRVQSQEVTSTRGAFSSGTTDLYFGLGDAASVDALTVRWPDGAIEEIGAGCAGCTITIDRRLEE